MAEYHLLTIWRIEAPLEEVYATIINSLNWPDWWTAVEKVQQLASGDADGINSVRRYTWRGELPYSLVLEVSATRIQQLLAIEGKARGDLEGIGRWRFSSKGPVSSVEFEWHVRTTKWWMNLLAPFARRLFIRNHTLVMKQGAEGLAELLNAPLLSQETQDLMAAIDAT